MFIHDWSLRLLETRVTSSRALYSLPFWEADIHPWKAKAHQISYYILCVVSKDMSRPNLISTSLRIHLPAPQCGAWRWIAALDAPYEAGNDMAGLVIPLGITNHARHSKWWINQARNWKTIPKSAAAASDETPTRSRLTNNQRQHGKRRAAAQRNATGTGHRQAE